MLKHKFSRIISLLPGLGVAIAIALISNVFSLGHSALDPLVLSILISIILGNLVGPYEKFNPGIQFAQKVFIPLGIILYGTQLDVRPLQMHGADRIIHILLMVVIGLFAILWICKKLGITRKIGMLLAAGSAICGASAIMVLSPVVKANREETSISLLSVTVVGLSGVVIYPLVQEFFSFPQDIYALLCGSTLYQLGSVKAAASFIGRDVVDLAVPVKLLRIATLLPIAVIYSVIAGREGKKIYVPWFILGFLLVAVVTNVIPGFHAYRESLTPLVAFSFSIAIAGIGLSVDIESIIDIGARPLLATFLGWLVFIALFIVGIMFVR